MSNTSIVEIKRLSHQYTSADWAVKDVNINVKKNGILGLLGSNGAGKSTTMNILCGVINQTKGQVLINGIDMQKKPKEAKKLIGFLPQKAPLYLDLTVDEYLTHCAHLRLMKPKEIKPAIKKVKERCGISHYSNRLLKNLSGGYQQRVGIAQAILHNPLLVVLDEPTNGLDPVQIVEVRKLIKEIAKDKAVILSTHILSEVEATCDMICMIEKGKMVFNGDLSEFKNHLQPDTLILIFEKKPDLGFLKEIKAIQDIISINDHKYRIKFNPASNINHKIIEKCSENKMPLSEIYLEQNSLDNVFAKLAMHD
ncbi:ABC transporter ATP-binding protein [uncultured Polaribacter sp.]|uniref:ABC transporter ATP-binding protein n=1 Tax=uncultured Polaribacter sp. TaxID=174711 RepID=UPI00262314C6|nr:ABC transporter ATP-binding protein [uncultured Polaribacter sp.]